MMVNLTFVEARFRTPPFVDLVFDAVLENTESQACWLLLPSYLTPDAGLGPLLASAVEIFELSGNGIVRIARFYGNEGFQAVRLPPGAKVTVHGLPVSMTGELPRGAITVPAIVAERLTIGGEPVEDWLPAGLTTAPRAEVTDEPGAIVASRSTADGKAAPVTPSGIRILALRVELSKP